MTEEKETPDYILKTQTTFPALQLIRLPSQILWCLSIRTIKQLKLQYDILKGKLGVSGSYSYAPKQMLRLSINFTQLRRIVCVSEMEAISGLFF